MVDFSALHELIRHSLMAAAIEAVGEAVWRTMPSYERQIIQANAFRLSIAECSHRLDLPCSRSMERAGKICSCNLAFGDSGNEQVASLGMLKAAAHADEWDLGPCNGTPWLAQWARGEIAKRAP